MGQYVPKQELPCVGLGGRVMTRVYLWLWGSPISGCLNN